MAGTPIIDAVVLAYATDWDSATPDMRTWWRLKSIDALRAALPWKLPADRLEAMARGATAIAGWRSLPISETERRMLVRAAYRADPIMRELYPERFFS